MMFVCRQTSHSAGSADASFWYLRIFALSLFLLQKCVLALNFAASLNLTWLFEHSQSRWCLYNATLAWISVVWSSGGARGSAVCGLLSRHCWFWFPVFGKTAVLHNMWHRRTDMSSLSFFFFQISSASGCELLFCQGVKWLWQIYDQSRLWKCTLKALMPVYQDALNQNRILLASRTQ